MLIDNHTMSPPFSTRYALLLYGFLTAALVTTVIALGIDADYVSKYANVYSPSDPDPLFWFTFHP